MNAKEVSIQRTLDHEYFSKFRKILHTCLKSSRSCIPSNNCFFIVGVGGIREVGGKMYKFL